MGRGRLKKFNIDFKTDKVIGLWMALSDKGFLCFDKVTNVNVRLRKKKNNRFTNYMPFKSRARLDCALNRIEDTLKYMNTIPLGSTAGKRSATCHPQFNRYNDEYDFIGIRVSDFVEYLNRWIDFIDKILIAVKKFETDRIEHYKKIPMKFVSEFSAYSDYIAYLMSEYVERVIGG